MATARWADLGARVTSAAVLIPAVLLDVWVGGIWFNLLVALLAVLMAHEWATIVHGGNSLQFAFHAAAALCGALLPLETGIAGATIAIAVLWALSVAVARWQSPVPAVWQYLGVPYVGAPALVLVLLRHDAAYGATVILWILTIVWAADSLAYFAGKSLGGPKLAPRLSPNKTWSGFAGAIVGSAIASAVFAWMAGLEAVAILALLAALLAPVEQMGDLFKSALKRHYGVKDSGSLIPGHGGIIDRLDGLVAVAVAAALIGVARRGFEATGEGVLLW